jgi:hypothetical protein
MVKAKESRTILGKVWFVGESSAQHRPGGVYGYRSVCLRRLELCEGLRLAAECLQCTVRHASQVGRDHSRGDENVVASGVEMNRWKGGIPCTVCPSPSASFFKP